MESLTKQRDIHFNTEHLGELGGVLVGESVFADPSFDLKLALSSGVDRGIDSDVDSDTDAVSEHDQAKLAIFLLADVEGVLDLKYLSESNLLITYDIRILTLNTIHQALSSVGFQLDNSLISKLKNALYAYTEDTLRENLGISGSKLTRDIFVQGYQNRLHGCRDLRSMYWRRYL